MGDILYRRAFMSFNARFISDYGTNEIEYMYPIFLDRVCFICPKSLRFPEWMAILRCFSVNVWKTIIILNFGLGCVWYFLKTIPM